MRWRLKQFWTTLLLITFFTTFLPHPLLADNPAVSLEQAIQTAKELFPVPPSYTEFNSQFISNVQGKSWVLRWQAREPEAGSLEVSIDADSGECINMNLWRPEKPADETGKALSEAEAGRIADNQLKRLLPKKAASLRCIKEPSLIYLNGYARHSCNFVWERYENGIPVLGNGVRMEIDSQTGEVRSYSLDWLDVPLEEVGKAISREEALKVFQNEKMLRLEYKAPREVRAYGSKIKDKPRLVYIINHPSNGAINAITGEPLVLKNGQWEENTERYENMKMSAGGMGAADSAPRLSPEEIKELEKNSRFIGQDEATARVKKWIAIPADAVLSNASLERDWQNQERRIWNLNWNRPATGKEETRDYNLWARVDALNGKIYAFHQSSDEQPVNSELTKEAAFAVADSFLRKIEPKLAGQVKLDEQSGSRPPILPLEKESQSQWDFSYTRLVNNVPFPQQGVSITVSSQDKRVVGYDLNWSEYDFPPADQAISVEEGNKVFLQAAPLTLCYTGIYRENSKPRLSLVYKPLAAAAQKDLAMIDAISKAALDAGGTPLSEKPGPRSFNDIKGHFAEKEISLIGSAGLMADYGQQFRPDGTINTIAFLRTLLGVRDGIGNTDQGEDARVINICQQRGWVKEQVDAHAPLSRDYMSRVLVRSMGLERVAQNADIFVNPYPGDPSINKSNLGYAALINGLGLIPSSADFNSKQTVTRAEVAYALVRSLNP